MKIVATPPTQKASPEETIEKRKLKKACQDFEAIFVTQMLKEMRPKDGDPVFGTSHQKEIYQQMLDEERAKDLTQKGSPLGIGEHLYNQLLSRLDASKNETDP